MEGLGMKILSLTATNFASYPSLEVSFNDLGLCLVSGPTGAGKSTVMDAVSWILYGQTGKDGNADEVRSWQNNGEPTRGVLELSLSNSSRCTVVRVRGGHSRNDLYWTEDNSDTPTRGKDLSETQKLLNEKLGVDFDSYTTGAYFHEFSPTASFFVANAKARRALFERVVDLSLPVKIAAKASEAKKAESQNVMSSSRELSLIDSRIGYLQDSLESERNKILSWETSRSLSVASLKKRAENFEEDKKVKVSAVKKRFRAWEEDVASKIDGLEKLRQEAEQSMSNPESSSCNSCGQSIPVGELKSHAEKEYTRLREELLALADKENPHATALDEARELTNQYDQIIEEELAKVNPFSESNYLPEIKELCEKKAEKTKAWEISLFRENAFERLYELSYDLRAALLNNSVRQIQDKTNDYLERFFDSVIKVSFELEGADSLKVGIQKSGYDCVYKQLSKGQRGLLRLSFSVAMMEAASNASGVHFDNIFMDEALDGLDTSLKLMAYRLFEELATKHESVMVIDHSEELKELFETRFNVSMESDASRIELV